MPIETKHARVECVDVLPGATQVPILFCGPPGDVDCISQSCFCTEMICLDAGAKVSVEKIRIMCSAKKAAGKTGYRPGFEISSIDLFYIDQSTGRCRLLTDNDVILTPTAIVASDAEVGSTAASATRQLPEDILRNIFRCLEGPNVTDVGAMHIRGLVCSCVFKAIKYSSSFHTAPHRYLHTTIRPVPSCIPLASTSLSSYNHSTSAIMYSPSFHIVIFIQPLDQCHHVFL